MRPLVLLSNDDGHAAPGLVTLRAELSSFADVVVCAPESEQSAASHSLTLHRALRLRRVGDAIYAIDGTPADCVYVAMHSHDRVLPRRPDLVVSGMNHGPNLGVDVFYSGTVAAAREGAIWGVPSLAVSADPGAAAEPAAALAASIARALVQDPLPAVPQGAVPLLNLNVPQGAAWSLRAARLGARLYAEEVVFRLDPRGREYLWIGGAGVKHEHVPGSDTEAYERGEASLTPLSLDLYHERMAEHAEALVAAARRRAALS